MGGATSTVADFSSLLPGEQFDTKGASAALDAWCKPYYLQCSPPFLVGWYNKKRRETAEGMNLIDAPDAAVAFALYTIPGYLDIIVEHFAREKPESNFVDAATNELLNNLRERLPANLDAVVYNTDEGPPYYHVQTVGAVAAVDEHIEAEDIADAEWQEDLSDRLDEVRDPKMWGTDPATRKKIFGVNVHPTWGGWYAYRALIVVREATPQGLVEPTPMAFLPDVDKRRILSEYNLRHELCIWRDLDASGHETNRCYTPEEYFFFTETSPQKRRRFLELRAAALIAAKGGAPPLRKS